MEHPFLGETLAAARGPRGAGARGQPLRCSPEARGRSSQQHLAEGNTEVREALTALKAESEPRPGRPLPRRPPRATAPLAAGEAGAPSSPASLAPSLACFGCARLPPEMDS